MNQDILNFIAGQRICVLAVEMLDGSPHAATVHFAHTDNPLRFFFETHGDSLKGKALNAKGTIRASLVIGFNENEMKTLQLDGEAQIVKDGETELWNQTYLTKFPAKGAKVADPKVMRLMFIPKWWRYTDWKAPQGKLILTSTDN